MPIRIGGLESPASAYGAPDIDTWTACAGSKSGGDTTSDVIAFLKDSHVLAGQSSAVSANDAIQTARATGPKFVKPGSNSEIGGRLLAV